MTQPPPAGHYAQAPPPPGFYTAPPPTYNEAVGGETPGFKPPPMVTNLACVGPDPVTLTCPNCGMNIETSTRAEPGLIAWISGVLIFLFGFWCGCCLIPCCIDSCMDVHHTCPNCRAYLGRYRR